MNEGTYQDLLKILVNDKIFQKKYDFWGFESFFYLKNHCVNKRFESFRKIKGGGVNTKTNLVKRIFRQQVHKIPIEEWASAELVEEVQLVAYPMGKGLTGSMGEEVN